MQFPLTYFIYQIKNHIILRIIETVIFTKNISTNIYYTAVIDIKIKRSLLNGNKIKKKHMRKLTFIHISK